MNIDETACASCGRLLQAAGCCPFGRAVMRRVIARSRLIETAKSVQPKRSLLNRSQIRRLSLTI